MASTRGKDTDMFVDQLRNDVCCNCKRVHNSFSMVDTIHAILRINAIAIGSGIYPISASTNAV